MGTCHKVNGSRRSASSRLGHSSRAGSSPSFRAVLDKIDAVAHAGCTVLLCGETGTGKEVVAHAIHDRSEPLNCAAVPAALL